MTLLVVEDQSPSAELEHQTLLLDLIWQLHLEHFVRMQVAACLVVQEVVEAHMSAFFFDSCICLTTILRLECFEGGFFKDL